MAKLGSFGSEFLIALYSRYQGMLESSEGVSELGESASRRVTHNCQLDATVSHHIDVSIEFPECLYDLAAASSRACDSRGEIEEKVKICFMS